MHLYILIVSRNLLRKSFHQQEKVGGGCGIAKLCKACDAKFYFVQINCLYGSQIIPHFSPIANITTRRQYWNYSVHDYTYLIVERNALKISASFKNASFLSHACEVASPCSMKPDLWYITLKKKKIY